MESIGCAREGGAIPVSEAAEKFDEENCSPSDCPNYCICGKLSKEEASGQNNNQ